MNLQAHLLLGGRSARTSGGPSVPLHGTGGRSATNPSPAQPTHRINRDGWATQLTRRLADWPTRRLAVVLLLLTAAITPAATHAQSHQGDFGMTYTQERTKFANDYCGCFYLRGATIDTAYSFYKGIGIAGAASGVAATNLHGSIDIHQISFMVGPRYTWNLGFIGPASENRRGGIFVEGKVGYTFATSGLYPVNGTFTDHASALTYQGGGGINYTIYHRFDLRLIEADFVRTQLPNGGNNQQNVLRLASGINFHIGH